MNALKRTTALILLSVISLSFIQTNVVSTGNAYNKDNPSNLLFIETNTDVINNNKLEETSTVFKDKNGKLLAEKKTNFRKSSLHPDFKMENKVNGCVEGMEKVGNDFKIFYKKNKNSELKYKTISVPPPAVADAGINNLIKDNFEKLKKGETVVFNMIAPERFDYYSFRFTKEKTTKFNGKDALVIKMESDSYIIRQLIDPIMMTFEVSTKKMLQYEGVSNITDNDGDRYEVKVIYE